MYYGICPCYTYWLLSKLEPELDPKTLCLVSHVFLPLQSDYAPASSKISPIVEQREEVRNYKFHGTLIML